MPRADQTSQAEPPGAPSFDHPRDLSHEENLAAALSSFLSQLNSSFEVPRLDQMVDVTDSAVAPPALSQAPGPALLAEMPGELGDIYPERAPKRARYHRPLVAGAMAAAVLTATIFGITVAWERVGSTDLNVRAQQLAALESTLASTRTSLTAQVQRDLALQAELRDSAHQWTVLKGQLGQNEDQLSQTRGQLNRAQDELGEAQSQVGLAQSRADQAQSRADQAQNQLSHTQLALSAAQAHAALCQQGVALGQQSDQLLTSLVSLENAYLTASAAKDAAQVQADLAQMQSLDAQAEALGPRFSYSVQLCTSGG